MPLILDESGDNKLLYFQKYYVHENNLKKRIETFLNAEPSRIIHDTEIDDLLEKIYSSALVIRAGRHHAPIIKDTDQINALKLALTSQFTIISGGPGTGKTLLMVNILRSLVRAGVQSSRIILCAPTGRAAQRMTETIQNNILSIEKPSREDSDLLSLKGSTLHRTLRYRRYRHDFYYRDTNPLPASVVLVDEVSMVDVVMMDNFLKAIDPAKTKLILLGDKDQLPAVAAGAVFAEMIPNGNRARRFKSRFIVLRKVYRSEANLLQLATQINRGAFPSFKAVSFEIALSSKPDQWAFVDVESTDQWREQIYKWLQHQYFNPMPEHGKSYKDLIVDAGKMNIDRLITTKPGRYLLDKIFLIVERAKILSIIRKGIFGCTGINLLITDYLTKKFNTPAVRQTGAFHGALIIITRNDYTKELYNGDIGVIIRDPEGTYRAFFQRSGSYISFPVNLLPPWELAFAITVHKSQGSEFDNVLLVLPDDETNRLLTREIVYTGITRARKRVLLCGSRSSLNIALQRKIERQSGLMW